MGRDAQDFLARETPVGQPKEQRRRVGDPAAGRERNVHEAVRNAVRLPEDRGRVGLVDGEVRGGEDHGDVVEAKRRPSCLGAAIRLEKRPDLSREDLELAADAGALEHGQASIARRPAVGERGAPRRLPDRDVALELSEQGRRGLRGQVESGEELALRSRSEHPHALPGGPRPQAHGRRLTVHRQPERIVFLPRAGRRPDGVAGRERPRPLGGGGEVFLEFDARRHRVNVQVRGASERAEDLVEGPRRVGDPENVDLSGKDRRKLAGGQGSRTPSARSATSLRIPATAARRARRASRAGSRLRAATLPSRLRVPRFRARSVPPPTPRASRGASSRIPRKGARPGRRAARRAARTHPGRHPPRAGNRAATRDPGRRAPWDRTGESGAGLCSRCPATILASGRHRSITSPRKCRRKGV